VADEQAPESRTLGAISIYRDDVAVVISASNADLEARIDKSRRHVWFNGAWHIFDLPQACIAVRTWKGQSMNTFYLSHDGIMLHSDGKGPFTGAPLDTGPDGPSNLVMMRNMKLKDDTMIAVGMARMAYEKKVPSGPWRKIDQGMFVPRGQRTQSVGLNDVAFDQQGGLVAVGYKGEIWHRPAGGSWTSLTSPTNVYLSAIAANPNADELTIVGLNGLVLQGSPRAGWTVVADAPTLNFWSVEYFGGAIYIASERGLFRLRSGAFAPVDFGTGATVTTGRVEASTGQIWSVGSRDVLKSTDGLAWTALPSPI